MRCHGVAHGHEVCKTYELPKIKMARLQSDLHLKKKSVQLIAMSYQPATKAHYSLAATQNKIQIGSFGMWDHSLFSKPAFFVILPGPDVF